MIQNALKYCDAENESLRLRLDALKAEMTDFLDTLDEYDRGLCSADFVRTKREALRQSIGVKKREPMKVIVRKR